MSLKNTADIDKPREKLIARGASSLVLEELIAAIIGRGTVGCDALMIGKAVGSILKSTTYQTTISDLTAVTGMGEAKACQILAALELARRFPPPIQRCATIMSAEDVLPFVTQYRYDTQENVIVVTLSGAHEILNVRPITRGLLDNCSIHPREIYVGAIEDRAAAIILVHNHPSGRLRPSARDIEATREIKNAGEILGISLLDHLVIGPCDGAVSVLSILNAE